MTHRIKEWNIDGNIVTLYEIDHLYGDNVYWLYWESENGPVTFGLIENGEVYYVGLDKVPAVVKDNLDMFLVPA